MSPKRGQSLHVALTTMKGWPPCLGFSHVAHIWAGRGQGPVTTTGRARRNGESGHCAWGRPSGREGAGPALTLEPPALHSQPSTQSPRVLGNNLCSFQGLDPRFSVPRQAGFLWAIPTSSALDQRPRGDLKLSWEMGQVSWAGHQASCTVASVPKTPCWGMRPPAGTQV